jgi:hypothetical protein
LDYTEAARDLARSLRVCSASRKRNADQRSGLQLERKQALSDLLGDINEAADFNSDQYEGPVAINSVLIEPIDDLVRLVLDRAVALSGALRWHGQIF